jgi:hypothetical protein
MTVEDNIFKIFRKEFQVILNDNFEIKSIEEREIDDILYIIFMILFEYVHQQVLKKLFL